MDIGPIQWYDVVRILTTTWALGTMYELAKSFIQTPKPVSSRMKDYWWVMNTLMFALIIFSLENIITDRHSTPGLFIAFFSMGVAYRAAVRKGPLLDPDEDSFAPRKLWYERIYFGFTKLIAR